MLRPEPFFGDVSWHCKPGPHSIAREDWAAFLAGAKRRFGMEESAGQFNAETQRRRDAQRSSKMS